MNEYILIPELRINKNFKKKVFINENSRNLNLDYFNKNDETIRYLDANRHERYKESQYIESVTQKIIEILTSVFNEVHKENYSNRYWEIILRPWLYVFLYATRNRYKKIQYILNKKKKIKFLGNFIFNKILIPSDTKDFNLVHCTNEWNNFMYYKIYKNITKKKTLKKDYFINEKNIKIKFKQKKILKNFIDDFFKHFDFGYNKIFVHNSGMNFLDELLLNVILFQVPRFYYEKENKKFNSNLKLRSIINDKIKKNYKKKNDKFLNFLMEMIAYQVPSMVLEGYKYYKYNCLKQKFPKKPMVIFTSNSFNTNEMFKFYTAHHLEKTKSPTYIVGQHGNSYNTNILNKYLPEIVTSDFFLNWGVNKKKQISFCNFISRKEEYKKENKQYLLIVLRSRGEKRTLFDQELQNRNCDDYVMKFLENLDLQKIDKILLKPHFNHNLKSHFYEEIKLKYPKIKILKPTFKINKIFKYCKLVVYNYDSTSYLQLLSSNFPTVAFWKGNDSHVLNEMRPIYNTLNKNYLWSSNPSKLSKIINNNWLKIDQWWFETKRQKAIKVVQKKICKPREKFFLFKLKKILLSKFK